jgi:hypothetical protein
MKHLFLVIAFLALTTTFGFAQAPAVSSQPFVVEYYYKAKWGHADEFLKLFKKNHYPLLKKEVEMGRMLKVWMDQPRYHTTEDGRWDYRVTIVFKNATVAKEAALSRSGDLHPRGAAPLRDSRRTLGLADQDSGFGEVSLKTPRTPRREIENIIIPSHPEPHLCGEDVPRNLQLT